MENENVKYMFAYLLIGQNITKVTKISFILLKNLFYTKYYSSFTQRCLFTDSGSCMWKLYAKLKLNLKLWLARRNGILHTALSNSVNSLYLSWSSDVCVELKWAWQIILQRWANVRFTFSIYSVFWRWIYTSQSVFLLIHSFLINNQDFITNLLSFSNNKRSFYTFIWN